MIQGVESRGRPGLTYTPSGLSTDEDVDNTDALQFFLDSVPDGTVGKPNIALLPAGSYRVDRTIRIQDRHNLIIGGASASARFEQWTNLTGQEAYPHPFDADPENHADDSAGWLHQNGVRTWRGPDGQSQRQHWTIASPDNDCTNITLQHIKVTSCNLNRVATAPNYADADNGPNLWDSKEAEHGFLVGNSAFKPTVSNIRLVDCHAVNTFGDGFTIDVDHTTHAGILLDGCVSQWAGRHSMAIVGGWGVVVRGFEGTGAFSAILDIEPNNDVSGVRGVVLLDVKGASHRIPILVQNGHAGSLNQDIMIDGLTISDHGFGATVWYPVVYADTVTATPVGRLTLRNIQLAAGAVWDCDGPALLRATGWPEVVVSDCELGFGVNRAASYGVRLTDVGSYTMTGNDFNNCGGDVEIVTTP